jgi:hypothetical protein
MKKIILFALIALTACANEPLKTDTSDNTNIKVDKLFTYDSITVYRFLDAGHYHYFTKNLTSSTLSCGKNCTYNETIENKTPNPKQ